MNFTLLAVAALLLQAGASSPEDLLRLQRPLTAAEIDVVVSGTRQALAEMTLRFLPDRTYADRVVLMGRAGTPHMIRHTVTNESLATVTTDGSIAGPVQCITEPERFVKLTEYTGVPARRCTGAPATGEMVIEYDMNAKTQKWAVTARESGPGDIAIARPFEMLRTPASLTIGETRLVGNRIARAIVMPWSPLSSRGEPLITGDPAPNAAEFVPVQSLWIDTTSLLPLRWELSQRQAIVGAFDFVYESLQLQRPAAVEVPKCIT